MNHSFDTEIARYVGVNAAVIYENIKFWCAKNKANNHNFYDDEYWTYNSVSAWSELFSYMTKSQIRTALKKLEDSDLIMSGNYNDNKYDRSKWYCVKSQVHLSSIANGNDTSSKCIVDTDINTVVTTDNKHIVEKIVDHLNQVLNKNYKHTGQKIKSLINARLKEGFTLEDFQKVHIVKYSEWNKTDMQKYLRPETLYGTKFESYLNQELSEYEKAKVICKMKGITMQELMQQGEMT